ncbi:DUF1415 domain-containing protein [Marinobacter caseinilyticus]|uniref:DUF1415 domain-containing protein n=1 Tax=Marinobacter caseinilyticus TaxID=2692195 RepID=UPI00140B882F|nr:DUF1415 domain-containing protein [Marinobacter caseinilyticus]
MNPDHKEFIENTRQWLERAVIGLNLCPFARAPYLRGQVRFDVSKASTAEDLLEDLVTALQHLSAADPKQTETTLLVHPYVLLDFIDFNDFLAVADATIEALHLEGVVQIASFHPDYQFAGSNVHDIDNYTNRSPYPILHLLRESSVEQAMESMEDTNALYEANIATLNKLGKEGWEKLWDSEDDTDASR